MVATRSRKEDVEIHRGTVRWSVWFIDVHVAGVAPPSGNMSRERGSFEATFGTLKHVRDPLPFPLVSGL